MLILIFITQVYGSCISSIGNLMADTLTDPKLELAKLAPYIYFSGKGINDFGLYEDCTNQYQYAVVQFFVPSTPASVNVGICFTKECSITDINSSIQTLKQWILAVAQEITQVDLTEYELKLLDSQFIASPQMPTYIFISCLIAFILLQIFFTLFHKQELKVPQQQIRQQQQRDIQDISTYFDEEEYFINHDNQLNQGKKSIKINEFYELYINLNLKVNYQECCKPQETKYYSLNGIRVLGFLMCVFGNTGISMLLQCDFYQVQHYSKHYILLIVFGCLYSVEIFLWLSGFFAVISLIKLNCLYSLLLRIWKIWPLMILIILINIVCSKVNFSLFLI